MNLKEFKNLVLTRKEMIKKTSDLYEMYIQGGSRESLEEYNDMLKKVAEFESKMLTKNSNPSIDMDTKLSNIFKITSVNFEECVGQYFEDYRPFFIYTEGDKTTISVEGNKYKFEYKNYIVLDSLYKPSESDLTKLIADYPQLEQVLWSFVESKIKNRHEEKRDGLVAQLIDVEREIKRLSDPEIREKELESLYNEKSRIKQEYQDSAHTTDIVEI